MTKDKILESFAETLGEIDLSKEAEKTKALQEEADFMLTELQDKEKKFNSWEEGFVNSLINQIDVKNFTNNQMAKLREVYDKYCS